MSATKEMRKYLTNKGHQIIYTLSSSGLNKLSDFNEMEIIAVYNNNAMDSGKNHSQFSI